MSEPQVQPPQAPAQPASPGTPAPPAAQPPVTQPGQSYTFGQRTFNKDEMEKMIQDNDQLAELTRGQHAKFQELAEQRKALTANAGLGEVMRNTMVAPDNEEAAEALKAYVENDPQLKAFMDQANAEAGGEQPQVPGDPAAPAADPSLELIVQQLQKQQKFIDQFQAREQQQQQEEDLKKEFGYLDNIFDKDEVLSKIPEMLKERSKQQFREKVHYECYVNRRDPQQVTPQVMQEMRTWANDLGKVSSANQQPGLPGLGTGSQLPQAILSQDPIKRVPVGLPGYGASFAGRVMQFLKKKGVAPPP